jgi:hypothetical protein
MTRSSARHAHLSVALALVAAVVAPRDVEARPILAHVEFAFPFTYPDLEFGQGLGFARIQTGGIEGNLDDQLRGPHGTFQIVGGDIHLVSGPLVDVTPTSDDAVYTHAAGGSLSITFDLELRDGSIHHGMFTAPLGEFVIHAGGTSGDLGPGLFDPVTAHILGIKPRTLSSPDGASLYLDMYDSYPQLHREAQAFGYMPIVAVVPEPGTCLLVVVGLGAALRRKRHG